MVDYSKWDFIEDEDEELKTPSSPSRSRAPGDGAAGRVDGAGGLDPGLMRQLETLKTEDPDKLKDLEAELEMMKSRALEQKARASAGGGGTGVGETGKVANGIKSQADVLKQSMAALDKKKRDMESQMAQLEQLAAAGDGESVMRFFQSQGLTPEDMQRMMGGSESDTHDVLGQAAAKNAREGTYEKESDSALKFADQLNAAVCGDDLPSSPEEGLVDLGKEEEEEEEEEQESVVAPLAPTKQIIIPEHMQQLGKEGVVIMIVRLPRLESAADVQLDVAPRAFKLRAEIPGEESEYALSLELGSTVDPASSRAKWKKKESSLRIELSPPSLSR